MAKTLSIPAIPWFEVLWCEDHDGIIHDVFTEDFATEEEAMTFYNAHKNDAGKYGWKVTKRTYKFHVLKTYVDEYRKVTK